MKNLITAITLAGAAAGAFAAEYTNFDIPKSVLTRAEVRAQIAAPSGNGAIQLGDATQFELPAATMATSGMRSAATPRAERINTRNASYLSADLPGRI